MRMLKNSEIIKMGSEKRERQVLENFASKQIKF